MTRLRAARNGAAVAGLAGARVRISKRLASRRKTRSVRADAAAHSGGAVANDAVAFRVAAGAGIHGASCFRCVPPGTVDPARRMKTAGGRRNRRRHGREAETRVAFGAEALDRVAASASRVVASRHGAVHSEKVVGVYAGRSGSAVMTVDALALVVALRAHFAVVRCHPSVPNKKISIVLHVEEPLRR